MLINLYVGFDPENVDIFAVSRKLLSILQTWLIDWTWIFMLDKRVLHNIFAHVNIIRATSDINYHLYMNHTESQMLEKVQK